MNINEQKYTNFIMADNKALKTLLLGIDFCDNYFKILVKIQ